MRKPEEIVKKIKESQNEFMSFHGEVLIEYLTFDQAAEVRSEDITADKWGEPKPMTREAVMAEMAEYMEFAWGKVDDHRGLSAGRSVDKMLAWLWLLGDDETLARVNAAGYTNYGAPKLAVICRALGFPIPDDSGIQNMINGDPCHDGCDNGCG